jgi:hypothetical protein
MDDSCKCGALALPNSVYCEPHHQRCYIRVDTKLELTPAA